MTYVPMKLAASTLPSLFSLPSIHTPPLLMARCISVSQTNASQYVVNLTHSSRTISNDITIKVYPSYISISNPGDLPLGVTKDNILHTKHRRNPNMIEILTALGLMEGEYNAVCDILYTLAISSKLNGINLFGKGAPSLS